jgi:two-component system sensor histidine kinase MprB
VVSDHGPGIPPEERGLVFERFYRSMSARAMPGSGLGLAIVKQVVVKHGGMIRIADTVPGGQPPGTAFYVLLPGLPAGAMMYPDPSAESEITVKRAKTNGDRGHSQHKPPVVPSVISVDSQ